MVRPNPFECRSQSSGYSFRPSEQDRVNGDSRRDNHSTGPTSDPSSYRRSSRNLYVPDRPDRDYEAAQFQAPLAQRETNAGMFAPLPSPSARRASRLEAEARVLGAIEAAERDRQGVERAERQFQREAVHGMHHRDVESGHYDNSRSYGRSTAPSVERVKGSRARCSKFDAGFDDFPPYDGSGARGSRPHRHRRCPAQLSGGVFTDNMDMEDMGPRPCQRGGTRDSAGECYESKRHSSGYGTWI